ncbi:class I SAM-dependent methyltransferase [Pseudonocardia sp. KRD291]|uniref:class I SAM-dependent methyltransferase n=1 Tax=Pseudonocardia sp. KRD291 TaxID=2792007 RepID=UPI001C4A735D|nr:class I SAM-dependent methyltransferase [Pseudonocardia sp. KRD291]MBW0102319.1 class I SAM-dependent methyltransferase [Pseudonocardia sp. KRD291]
MAHGRSWDLGALEQTLLAPLQARAHDARRRRPLVPDPAAAGVVDLIGPEIGTGATGPAAAPRLDDLATVLRGAIFDHWVREFLTAHPSGTVVELGAGLSTRAERLMTDVRADTNWVDVDLPEVTALRRELLPETAGRRFVAGSVLDEDWLDVVRELPGPYLLVSESVLTLLPEQGVQRVVFTIGSVLPGATLLMDTVARSVADRLQRCEPLCSRGLMFDWTCEDPQELEPWGLQLKESRGSAELPEDVHRGLSLPARALAAAVRAAPQLRGHRLARYEVRAV